MAKTFRGMLQAVTTMAELAVPFLVRAWIIALRPAPLVVEIDFTPGGGWLSFWYTGTAESLGMVSVKWVLTQGPVGKIPQHPHAAGPAESRTTVWLHGRSARSSRCRTVRIA